MGGDDCFVIQFCQGGNDCTKKVHCTAEEGEGGIRQLHAAGQHQLASELEEGSDGKDKGGSRCALFNKILLQLGLHKEDTDYQKSYD